MTATALKVGDHVTIDPDIADDRHKGIVYKVEKVPTRKNEVNCTIVDPRTGLKLKANAEFLVKSDKAIVESVEVQEPVHLGTVVTIAGPGWKEPADQRWVVLQVKSDGKLKVAKLGGDGGRHYPGVPRHMATIDSTF